MRLTPKLNAQHIGFMFKKHWIFQGKRFPKDTGVEKIKAKGIQVIDANEFVAEKYDHAKYFIDIVGPYEKQLPLDKNHPEWKEKPCHTFGVNNALLEGLNQAQILTKSVVVNDALPEAIVEAAKVNHSLEIHDLVKDAILTANVFDCQQEKLPHIKDPERPAYIFPRILGITGVRKNIITTNKILSLLEKTSNGIAQERNAVWDPEMVTSFEKDEELVQFRLKSNILITSTKPLQPIVSNLEPFVGAELPNLFPLLSTIVIPTKHFYEVEDIYPISLGARAFHPHTTFLHYNKTQVKNIYQTPVTETQILARSLLHTFTIAAAYAKKLYGKDITLLPKPVTVQCVQTDGCDFYLGVLQLNSLDMNGTKGTKNIWYKSATIRLFSKCEYHKAQPILEGYNPQVYNYLHALYRNQ